MSKTNYGWIFEQLEGRNKDGRLILKLKDNIETMPTDVLGTAVRTERVQEFYERVAPIFEGRTISVDDRWCSRCANFKHKSRFTPDASRLSGVDRYCRSCRSAYRRELRAEQKKRWNDGKHLAAAVGQRRA
jgi:hypothetical protein